MLITGCVWMIEILGRWQGHLTVYTSKEVILAWNGLVLITPPFSHKTFSGEGASPRLTWLFDVFWIPSCFCLHNGQNWTDRTTILIVLKMDFEILNLILLWSYWRLRSSELGLCFLRICKRFPDFICLFYGIVLLGFDCWKDWSFIALVDSISVLSLIHIWRCRRYAVCRSRWSPYH